MLSMRSFFAITCFAVDFLFDMVRQSFEVAANGPTKFSEGVVGGGGVTPIYWDMGCAIFRVLFRLKNKFLGLFYGL